MLQIFSNRPRYSFAPAVALALLAGLFLTSHSAKAEMVYETEPNDTFSNANTTIGFNNLGFSGTLTVGDIDTFTIHVIPNSSGTISVAFTTTFIPLDGTAPSAIMERHFKTVGTTITPTGGGGTGTVSGTKIVSGSSFGSTNATEGDIYLQIFSASTVVTGNQSVPSTVAGTYSITDITGLNGTIVTGTAGVGAAAPEPASVLLLAPIIAAAAYFSGRRRLR